MNNIGFQLLPLSNLDYGIAHSEDIIKLLIWNEDVNSHDFPPQGRAGQEEAPCTGQNFYPERATGYKKPTNAAAAYSSRGLSRPSPMP